VTIELLAAAPTSGITEREIVGGYSRLTGTAWGPRVEPCACGAVLEVDDAEDWPAVGRMLLVHYLSTGHAQWAVRTGWR
jgi:hypothetical protein